MSYRYKAYTKSKRSAPQIIFEDLELPFELTCTRMLDFGAVFIYPVDKAFVYTVVACKVVGLDGERVSLSSNKYAFRVHTGKGSPLNDCSAIAHAPIIKRSLWKILIMEGHPNEEPKKSIRCGIRYTEARSSRSI